MKSGLFLKFGVAVDTEILVRLVFETETNGDWLP